VVYSSPISTLSRQAHLQSKYFRSKASGKARNDDDGCSSSPGNASRRSIVNGDEAKPRRKRPGSAGGPSSTTPPAEKKERTHDGDQDHALEVRLSRHFQPRIPPPVRRAKIARGYAAPSVYQHLAHLPDLITPNLDVLFCGSNPGCQSAKISHYYGHRSNHFWKYLFRSGFTPYCLSPYDDHLLPSKFGLGLTDLVSRPTTEANELAPAERREAVPILLEKIRKFQPRFLCFVGIKQYEDVSI